MPLVRRHTRMHTHGDAHTQRTHTHQHNTHAHAHAALTDTRRIFLPSEGRLAASCKVLKHSHSRGRVGWSSRLQPSWCVRPSGPSFRSSSTGSRCRRSSSSSSSPSWHASRRDRQGIRCMLIDHATSRRSNNSVHSTRLVCSLKVVPG